MEYRRQRGDMIQVYKISNNLDRIDINNFFVQVKSTTRGHCKKLFKKRYEKDIRKYTFSQRVIDDWNSLNNEIVLAESLNSFKSKLDKYWAEYNHYFNH